MIHMGVSLAILLGLYLLIRLNRVDHVGAMLCSAVITISVGALKEMSDAFIDFEDVFHNFIGIAIGLLLLRLVGRR